MSLADFLAKADTQEIEHAVPEEQAELDEEQQQQDWAEALANDDEALLKLRGIDVHFDSDDYHTDEEEGSDGESESQNEADVQQSDGEGESDSSSSEAPAPAARRSTKSAPVGLDSMLLTLVAGPVVLARNKTTAAPVVAPQEETHSDQDENAATGEVALKENKQIKNSKKADSKLASKTESAEQKHQDSEVAEAAAKKKAASTVTAFQPKKADAVVFISNLPFKTVSEASIEALMHDQIGSVRQVHLERSASGRVAG